MLQEGGSGDVSGPDCLDLLQSSLRWEMEEKTAFFGLQITDFNACLSSYLCCFSIRRFGEQIG